ncbi:MAG: hypothetical protein FWG06_00975 [Clostridiales bacterium]|nr:hypothetical protein [Clostridiales bacterium]
MTSLKSALSAIDWICAAGEAIDAFLCPGHVSVVTGADAYIPLAEKYNRPFIVAGFEGERLLAAVRAAAEYAAEGRSGMRNLYPEAVSAQGNRKAQEVTARYFTLGGAMWRGLGHVDQSGYYLRDKIRYDQFRPLEADIRYVPFCPPADCRCGDVILGRIDPDSCPLFGTACTPVSAVGPCMVSSEGACGAWYRNRSNL